MFEKMKAHEMQRQRQKRSNEFDQRKNRVEKEFTVASSGADECTNE